MAVKEKKSNVLSTFDWRTVVDQFDLSREYIHLGASQFISSHPRIVREAIERYRRALDENPVLYMRENEDKLMDHVRKAAARYLVARPEDIALTDSTTMGLAILYNGLKLQPGQEILSTEHEHYSHYQSIQMAAEKKDIPVRRIRLYKDIAHVTEEEIIETIIKAISPRTRVVGLTWVHSSTGLKLPIARIGKELAHINKERSEEDRILFCVDGVHGFGIEEETMPQLGCDFFVSGCHKWLYGPRGTGLICARAGAWELVAPTIPSFSYAMDRWSAGEAPPDQMDGIQMTPGGFHSCEYRWATCEAFDFHNQVGKKHIADRVHELNTLCKEGLADIPNVRVITPMSPKLSAGIVSFQVKGQRPDKTVEKLLKHKVIATPAPYTPSYARFTPGIYNLPEEIAAGVKAVREI